MAGVTQLGARPAPSADPTQRSGYRTAGLGLALVGMMGATVSVIANFVAGANIDADNTYSETLAWTFGLSIFSFGLVKIAISIILMGIIVRLWFRADAIKLALAKLHGDSENAPKTTLGDISTDWGKATVTANPPKLLPIHKMARLMWRPMLVMGAMALTAGLISSFVWASETPGTEGFRQAAAFTQGIEFLGEAMLLSGIAFLLGTILAGLREGGGEVQSSLGLPVTTLKMPATAKAFVVLMMMGMMVMAGGIVVNFIGAGSFNGTDAADLISSARYGAVGSGLRRLGVVMYLTGIAFGLGTIIEVLRFQATRIGEVAAHQGHQH